VYSKRLFELQRTTTGTSFVVVQFTVVVVVVVDFGPIFVLENSHKLMLIWPIRSEGQKMCSV